MKKFILIAVVAVFFNKAYSQADSASSHARQLLEVTGSGKLGMQVMSSMIASFKQNIPGVGDDFWDEFMKEVDTKELVELIVPIYVKYYTDEEMVQLIAFYKSPLGQKVVEKLPVIMQESFNTGQEWGKKIGEKAVEKLQAKGYLKKG